MAKSKRNNTNIIDAGTPDGGKRYELELRGRRFIIHAYTEKWEVLAAVTETTGFDTDDHWTMPIVRNDINSIIKELETMMDREAAAERREVC